MSVDDDDSGGSLEVNSDVSENSSPPSEESVSMVCGVRVVDIIGNIT